MVALANFSYFVQDRVAASAHPGRGENLAESLAELHKLGFTGILSVCERPLEDSMLKEFEIEGLHLEVPDFSAPTPDQIDRAVDFLARHDEPGSRVLVHCFAGYGRTGTILACYLVSQGKAAGEAIREVRRLRPGSIEDASQERAIHDYDRRLRGLRTRGGAEEEA